MSTTYRNIPKQCEVQISMDEEGLMLESDGGQIFICIKNIPIFQDLIAEAVREFEENN